MGKLHNEMSSPGRGGIRRKAFQEYRSLSKGKKSERNGKKLEEVLMDYLPELLRVVEEKEQKLRIKNSSQQYLSVPIYFFTFCA